MSTAVPPVCRCREVEQDVVTLKAQLLEKQTVQTENHRLKLQLESMEAQCRVEQRKAGEERSETFTGQDNGQDTFSCPLSWYCVHLIFICLFLQRAVKVMYRTTFIEMLHSIKIVWSSLTGTRWPSWRTPIPSCLKTTTSSKRNRRRERSIYLASYTP